MGGGLESFCVGHVYGADGAKGHITGGHHKRYTYEDRRTEGKLTVWEEQCTKGKPDQKICLMKITSQNFQKSKYFKNIILQPGHYSSLTAPNLQPTANQERNDQCGNQHHSRELLMMGTVMSETCSAYKKYNKIISGI